MLKSLDILIGFSVVMLMVSMSVTLIVEWFLRLTKMRGTMLLAGVETLIQQIDPKLLTAAFAKDIATKVLEHPLAAKGCKLAEVIQREDLIKIIMQLAADAKAQMPPPSGTTATVGSTAPPAVTTTAAAPTTAEQALVAALAASGVPNPGPTLDSVRMLSMRLEAAQPELATHVREATALITEAESRFVATINGWFDQTMDRVSHSYANHSRVWTFWISVVLVVILQLDAFKLINRLSMDDALRKSLLDQAQTISQTAPPTAPTGNVEEKDLQLRTDENVAQLKVLASDKLLSLPSDPKKWWADWGQTSVFGVLLAGILVSFGAPFWFKTLGDLLKLRPAMAAKEDQQRQQRQTAQPPAVGVNLQPSASGERGDLAAG